MHKDEEDRVQMTGDVEFGGESAAFLNPQSWDDSLTISIYIYISRCIPRENNWFGRHVKSSCTWVPTG
jgi:hypothetical protein